MPPTLQSSSPVSDSKRAAPPHNYSTGELITYIIERFHNKYRRDLPGLVVLARQVESVHGDHPEAPKGLADFLDEVAESLNEHMQKEEQILFSMLKSGGHPTVSRLIAMMRMEHDDHASNLDNILALTNGLKAPEGACGSWRALYEGLGELQAELKEQIRIENEVLFPRFSE